MSVTVKDLLSIVDGRRKQSESFADTDTSTNIESDTFQFQHTLELVSLAFNLEMRLFWPAYYKTDS